MDVTLKKEGHRMLRKLLMSTVVLLGAMGAAAAADLPSAKGPPIYAPPPPPIFTWTGLYIGGQVGYEWGYDGVNVAGVGLPSYAPNGVVGGGHLGYNYQIGQFVVGLEGDVNGSNYTGASTFGALGYSSTVNVDGSVRGRVGVAWDRALFYATGGAAFAGFQDRYTVGAATGAPNSTQVGWTVGGGVEYAIDPNWSIRAEYRYTDYGPYSIYSPAGVIGTFNEHAIDNRVQAGFSYKFDLFGLPGPVVAKY
jgi:outer membrane immunogenic protein